MRKICLVPLIAALATATVSEKATAFSRAYLPLNVAVLQADAIVKAKTIRAPHGYRTAERTAMVEVQQVFKGSLKTGPLSIELQTTHELALGYLHPGKTSLLFLRSLSTGPLKFEVMLDGTSLHSEKTAKSIETAVELNPAWSEPQNGLSTVLTAEKFRLGINDDVNLWIGYKNTSSKDITLKYSNWPLQTHTFWKLKVVPKEGKEIKALDHPSLTQAKIDHYFSRFPMSHQVQLKPGKSTFFHIPRINSAKPGWGYKEKLDFQYHPMTAPGKYTISAFAHHLFSKSIITAKGLQVWLE